MALPGYWATVVTHTKAERYRQPTAERYRQLARDCHFLARSLPPGESRSAMIGMAEEWDRLADQQERATDLRDGKHHGR
jgi:hypothetical protein